ncbi:ADP-forming succinate--CoA ligase subunit beta [Alphaproteobacteria bacterium]|jgi:succinyl-CoA synthetase beta subunit|nr:ADP-forming succinate--CoA ligase subunit beta [Alphaproteobacteria bacterium]MDB0032603.1 ADP-forming succinate--CoA ligase subunit beta [Alphaproteobacteria bacterium]MDB2371569.1 ADP-forming succinate--CoA ligase subunit beta [Alphaproteobacteria bacterium]
MNLHEYQAKMLLKNNDVRVLAGNPVLNDNEIESAVDSIQTSVMVVKSQIHAGGRGAGRFKDSGDDKGGVRVCFSKEEAKENAKKMLGKTLVTKQTGPDGKVVNRLYIEEGCDIKKEFYLSMLVDRSTSSISIIASTEGGMEIEEVAEKEPEKIITVNVPGDKSIDQTSLDRLVQGLNITSEQSADFCDQIQKIYTSFLSTDASLVEVNPFVLTGEGNFLALDAKVSIDDNALYKHKDIAEMLDETEEDPAEIEASKHELNYVKLDGSIGCMVNGAGLAMGTMDIIQLHGGSPANFLDVGGGATKERVAKAFSIILQDPNVKVILVNIFGGIMKCDIIAEGVVAAAKELSIQVPLVVRLEGTNVELGKEILNKSNLAIISADNLEDAAQKAVGALS